MDMMGFPCRGRGTESGNGGDRSPGNTCEVQIRWHEQGDGLGEGPAMPREDRETGALCYFRGVNTGRCMSFRPKAVGTKRANPASLGGSTGALSLRPLGLASQAHMMLGITPGFPGPCFLLLTLMAWGGHLSGWMESPA